MIVGGPVAIEGFVIAPASLLDAAGRRIVVADPSGGIEVLVPSTSAPPQPGARVRVVGEVGRAYGAPRLRATAIEAIGRGSIDPLDLHRPPDAAHEWRLVRIVGTVADLRRIGQRWRAELRLANGLEALVDGLIGAAIDPELVAEGRRLRVTGIVRRPFPTATDRRFAVLPRSTADVAVLSVPHDGPSRDDDRGRRSVSGAAVATTRQAAPGLVAPDVDLADLAGHADERVRVGGLVVTVAPDGINLDDGTAIGRVRFTADAADYLPLLEPEDAVNVMGVVRADGDGFAVEVASGADVARVGDPQPPAAELGAEDVVVAASWGPATREEPVARVGLPAFDGGTAAPIAGAGSILVVAAASVAVTLARRRLAERRVATRAIARLARLVDPPDPA